MENNNKMIENYVRNIWV